MARIPNISTPIKHTKSNPMGSSEISSSLGANNLNHKKRKKTWKTKAFQRHLAWEFESYIRERLRALGIIQ
jgi:hypothetical protein